MNAAYKWYSHNSNIIQFYSGYSYSRKATSITADNVKEVVNCACNYATTNLVELQDNSEQNIDN